MPLMTHFPARRAGARRALGAAALAAALVPALPAALAAQLGSYNPPPGPAGVYAITNARIVTVTGPVIERGTEWKYGILRELGWPAQNQTDVAMGWKKILGTVRSYADLEPSLLARVEELIDFTTAG